MGQKYAVVDETRRIVAFYDDALHSKKAIPAGAIQISDDEHRALLEGQSHGKCMALCVRGRPAFADHPPPPIEERIEVAKNKRNRLLEQTDGMVARHRDQVEEGIETTLTEAQYRTLLAYRRELRDMTRMKGFPEVQWPAFPL
ncbi:phage tail assembly chaperone [Burkholderia sp. AU33545]|uniref:phage tail assembly chaperone n=1 Tax=Burkholderia sp. AU33545 TaxID=2879631 RepID=UPI001CF3D6DF|nr:phage tail assembly chaperone [Burkholderia sp. AU33545]MCA8205559.1 phage tail assembly chaperone [Burkholderia sp. AU33545]